MLKFNIYVIVTLTAKPLVKFQNDLQNYESKFVASIDMSDDTPRNGQKFILSIFESSWNDECFAKLPDSGGIWCFACLGSFLTAASEQLTSRPNTARCRYNVVNFLENPPKRHPIARPLGCLDILPNLYSASATAVMNAISCHIGPDCSAEENIWSSNRHELSYFYRQTFCVGSWHR